MAAPSSREKLVVSLHQRVRRLNPRLVFAEGEDERVLEAAGRAARDGLYRPTLLTSGRPIRGSAGLEILDILTDERRFSFTEQLAGIKRYQGEDPEALARRPLLFAALLVRNGYMDGGVAGACHTTADVIRAGLHIIGRASGMETVSSCFLMLDKERVISFADCAVLVEPTSRQLANIALATARTHRNISGQEPRIAFLSYSTKGATAHPQVRVQEAVRLLRARSSDLLCDGELQLDAALVPSVARTKAPRSPLRGNANVLIFPDLASGNIAYKLAQRLGGFQAVGPLVQGLAFPFMDLSRGCDREDILLVGCIAGILARRR